MGFQFYVGLHQPSDGRHFDIACISINRLRVRKKPVGARLLVDSGAFTELERYGKYRHSVEDYAAQLYRLYTSGAAEIVAAVAQDYMCEPFMLAKTGLSVEEHQRLTIDRYDALLIALKAKFGGAIPFHVLPVIQGFQPDDYARHVRAYGDRLTPGMWVGVGSVCKRQGDPRLVVAVLQAVLNERPDLRLHGFGVKLTSLRDARVRELLSTADSMAWSDHARWNGRNANDWREALAFVERINAAADPAPLPLLELAA
jgi:hypothetical protein